MLVGMFVYGLSISVSGCMHVLVMFDLSVSVSALVPISVCLFTDLHVFLSLFVSILGC